MQVVPTVVATFATVSNLPAAAAVALAIKDRNILSPPLERYGMIVVPKVIMSIVVIRRVGAGVPL